MHSFESLANRCCNIPTSRVYVHVRHVLRIACGAGTANALKYAIVTCAPLLVVCAPAPVLALNCRSLIYLHVHRPVVNDLTANHSSDTDVPYALSTHPKTTTHLRTALFDSEEGKEIEIQRARTSRHHDPSNALVETVSLESISR